MKKFIMTAVAAGALALGGAASAQTVDLGAVLTNILGFGGYTQGSGGVVQDGAPAYVYNGGPTGGPYTQQVDGYGNQVLVDAYGHIVDQFGRPVVADKYGRYYPVAPGATGNYAYSQPLYDRDRDGVPDVNDRRPNDPRRW